MKKIFYLAAAVLTLSLTSCEGWLDVNDNPNYLSDADKSLILPSVQLSIADKLGYDINLVGLFWSEYVNQNKNSNQYYTIMTYDLNNSSSSFTSPWSYFYTRTLPGLKDILSKCAESGDENYILEAKSTLAFTLYLMTSLYDDVAYTDSFLAEQTNVAPKFDNGRKMQEVIVSMLEEIRTISHDAAAAAEASSSTASSDMIFGGDTEAWFQFANTLYLKVLLRDFEANLAKITSLLAEDNFLEVDAAFDHFSDQADKSNPLYESDRRQLNTTQNIRCCTEILKVLSEQDPRLEKYYEGGAKGTIYGVTPTPAESNLFRITPTQPVYFATADESFFLQAEAYARIGNAAKAKACYEAAIDAAFTREGCADADDFTSGVYAFQAGSTESMVEQIINHKWASSVHSNPIEAWFDINRTGYPKVGETITFNPGVAGCYPKRFLIPNTSSDYNENSPAAKDPKGFADKMWWHK